MMKTKEYRREYYVKNKDAIQKNRKEKRKEHKKTARK